MDMDEMKNLIKTAVREVLAEQPKPMDLLTAYESKSYPVTFYNPAIASFGMSISVSRASIQIYMAPPIDKNVRGFAKPGEKRYDHPNAFVFGLTLHECFAISQHFDGILHKTWERVQEAGKPPIDEKYKHTMEFQHQTRRFFVGPINDSHGRPTLRVGIYDPEKTGDSKMINYILRPENGELDIFRSFMLNAVSLLPFIIAFAGGVVKNFKSAIFEVTSNKSNGNGNGNGAVTAAPSNSELGSGWSVPSTTTNTSAPSKDWETGGVPGNAETPPDDLKMPGGNPWDGPTQNPLKPSAPAPSSNTSFPIPDAPAFDVPSEVTAPTVAPQTQVQVNPEDVAWGF